MPDPQTPCAAFPVPIQLAHQEAHDLADFLFSVADLEGEPSEYKRQRAMEYAQRLRGAKQAAVLTSPPPPATEVLMLLAEYLETSERTDELIEMPGDSLAERLEISNRRVRIRARWREIGATRVRALAAAQPAPAPAGLREELDVLWGQMVAHVGWLNAQDAAAANDHNWDTAARYKGKADTLRSWADRLTRLLAQHPTPTPPAGAGAEAEEIAALEEQVREWNRQSEATAGQDRARLIDASYAALGVREALEGLASARAELERSRAALAQAQAEGGS